jgi:hypothetical protein
MSILESIRATDQMLLVVDARSRRKGMKDVTEFQERIAKNDPSGGTEFLEMAETLWIEHRDVLQTFYRRYFHHLSREQQRAVAYTTAVSFLDRPANSSSSAAEVF